MCKETSHWRRFANAHLGQWDGRCVTLRVQDGCVCVRNEYALCLRSCTRSVTNHSTMLTTWAHTSTNDLVLRYDMSTFHCFSDASYTAHHTLINLSPFTDEHITHAVATELVLMTSATERARVFLVYDSQAMLQYIVHLEEVRLQLFDTRAPLSFTALLGEWTGMAETYRHACKEERKSDISELEGSMLRTRVRVRYAWNPRAGTVRRVTQWSDLDGRILGYATVYGKLEQRDGAWLDSITFGENGAPDEVTCVLLPNAAYVLAPRRRVRGVPVAMEMGCLLTPTFRRRIVRVYGKTSVASETLSAERMEAQA